MNHVSLFTGIGGIDLAAEWAGFTTIAQVERDPYCLRVLERHWPGVHRCTDIRDFPDQEYGAVTLVSGGFPCQPFSAAGERKGTADDRHLWPEMYRVIRALAPRWVVAENVPGILSLDGGMVFESVCADLERAGYSVQTVVVPAAGVGAPHLRQRVFVVAHHEGEQVGIAGQPRLNEGMGLVGHADSAGRQQEPRGAYGDESADERRATLQADESQGASADVADAESSGRRGWTGKQRTGWRKRQSQGSEQDERRRAGDSDWWAAEPAVGRVATGVSRRVDRLRCLGNAVMPQQVYPILAAIAEVEREQDQD